MIIRKLAKQRSVSLFVDQEDELERIIKDKNLPSRVIPEIIRRGVDLVLEEIKSKGEI
ncbi:MAG: hypothetical protein H0Z24_05465 [Thermosipho sp. (in: Bacteria)]|nr:hypothetical protein [Thermosipho sp. (in: thermotogales)]